ncbi:hypothetical protein C491_06358 [Natronococcus amylolyticus DSM 10524]|uniref:Solute carrier family 6, member 8 n=1 Tax=Natronococcus amylolyticus DSM 10524 TaxID=1227497 RepID=L9XCF2_9EURY|nr:hypothetical protein [Natronococcus amylolyticus]ELY59410.1 hypothetical protein C491_06358 [Natronococcus amylolyticus DSM 10524]
MDARQLITTLRLAAVVLVVTGFVGWATGEATAFSLESPFTLAFLLGVACAVASIYLGIFLANRGE